MVIIPATQIHACNTRPLLPNALRSCSSVHRKPPIRRILGRESGHMGSDGVLLMREEYREVPLLHTSKPNFPTVDPGQRGPILRLLNEVGAGGKAITSAVVSLPCRNL